MPLVGLRSFLRHKKSDRSSVHRLCVNALSRAEIISTSRAHVTVKGTDTVSMPLVGLRSFLL